jgi:hypothetical protein
MWCGIAKGGDPDPGLPNWVGNDSHVHFEAPINGSYDVEFNFSEGDIQFDVDPLARQAQSFAPTETASGTIRINVPFETGMHMLRVKHSKHISVTRTVWDGDVNLVAVDEPLAVTSFTPTQEAENTPFTAVIEGKGIETHAKIEFIASNGISVTEVPDKYVDGNSHNTRLEVKVPATLLPSDVYDVRITNRASQAAGLANSSITLSDALTITLETFTLTSASPNVIESGNTGPLVIQGGNFTTDLALRLVGSGNFSTTLTNNTILNDVITATLPATLPIDTYDLVLTLARTGQSETLSDTLQVIAPFDVTSSSPGTVETGNTGPLMITGSNFSAGMTVTLVDSAGVTRTLTVSSVTTSTLQAALPADLAAGVYDVIVSRATPARSERLDDALTVVAPFTLMSASPSQVVVGDRGPLVINGSNFSAGMTVTLVDSAGVTTTLTVSSVTTSTLQAALPANLAAGVYDVVVSRATPAQTARLDDALTVVAPFAVTSVTPQTVTVGYTGTLTIKGSNFTNDITAVLISDTTRITLTVTFASDGELSAAPLNTLAVGTYDLELSRAAPAQTERVADALIVEPEAVATGTKLYMPLIAK